MKMKNFYALVMLLLGCNQRLHYILSVYIIQMNTINQVWQHSPVNLVTEKAETRAQVQCLHRLQVNPSGSWAAETLS